MKKICLSVLLGGLMLLWGLPLSAQVLQVSPVFPTVDDQVTITYDATQGNGALAGISPVHAHTGVITNASTTPTDWRNVQTQWGTADGLMTDLGNDLHQISYRIRDYYNLGANDEVDSLAFVFRDAAGNVVGRDTDGSDIYYPVYEAGVFYAKFLDAAAVRVVEPNESVDLRAAASEASSLSIDIEGSVLASVANDSLLDYTYSEANPGSYTLNFVADNGSETITDQVTIIVRAPIATAPIPGSAEEGITYLNNDSSALLVLRAPEKQYVYVIGEFNDWQPNPDYYMTLSPDSQFWWVQIDSLTPGEEYAYQYLIDGELTVGDPYTEKVLDPNNDPFLGDVYPNLKPYPAGASGIVSVLQPGKPDYQWQTDSWERPAPGELVVYELLVRDWVDDHSYQSVIDSLDYFTELGVNCIELMPIMEFEGNISWGYNPSYFFAVDKYYGTEYDLRAFIDSCHARGIVVLLDMVLNHAFGQSPMVRMYWDGDRPAANSPWFNQEATHPFNVGFDFNHESEATKYFTDRVLAYWVEEYRFDGYRMDLSKGFTQVNNPDDVGAWSAYDASRVALLNRMFDELRSVDSSVYFTLEHLGDNTEEKELAEYGMMLWSKLTDPYNEATMGYHGGNGSNFDGISYQQRNWDVPHNITYMESHDEERLMYKNLQFGNRDGGYDTRNVSTALDRMGAAATFFFPIPGPRLLWQFGELGYDFSINYCEDGGVREECRTGPKPIRWDYYQDPERRDLYDIYSALIHLRDKDSVFQTADYTLEVRPAVKRIYLRGEGSDDTEVFIIGNFDVTAVEEIPRFPSTGTWYEYFSQDSLEVTDLQQVASLGPGEYFLFSNEPFEQDQVNRQLRSLYETFTSVEGPAVEAATVALSPNPSQGELHLSYVLQRATPVKVELLDPQGRVLEQIFAGEQGAGPQEIHWQGSNLARGLYLLRIATAHDVQTLRWLVK